MIREPESDTVDDFESTYPNLQPFNDTNDVDYYITFAWNDIDSVPSTFRIGNEQRTTAIRMGNNESYFNAKLEESVQYCIYSTVHYLSQDGIVSYTQN